MAPVGKYFYIKSKLNDMVLDVKGGNTEPGTSVITWPKKAEESDNQLWYEDPIVGTIRSKLNRLCLDLNDDGEVVLNYFVEGRQEQQWLTSGDRIQNKGNAQRVFDIKGADRSEGATVIAWDAHTDDNQKWIFEYTAPRYFYVVSELNDRVLDSKKPEATPGSKVVVKDREDGSDSQLWYEDKFGVLCNKKHNLVPDSSADHKIHLQVDEPGNIYQLWTIQENRIINRAEPTKVLDIKGNSKKNGAKVIDHNWHGESNQRWRFEYI